MMRKHRSLIRLVLFLVVAGFLATMELTTLTGPHTGDTDTYRAIFAGPDGVSGLRDGNPVRVSGVAVGKVEAVELVDATHARVTFTANRNQRVTDRTWAVVRYANLLGQRYLALTVPPGPAGTPLGAGATIPDTRTQPALSLTALFNGFRPLFSALTPQQVNELAQDIIDILQGQSGRIDDLVARTADLTSNLAGRTQTFDQVIDNLATLLRTVASHDKQLAGVVVSLRDLAQALDGDGRGITDSLAAVDQLIGSVAELTREVQDHSLPADIRAASSLTGVLAGNTTTVDKLVVGFADAFATFSRVTQYGNWINVYPCNLFVRTYGDVTVTSGQVVQSLEQELKLDQGPLGGLLEGLLGGIPLDKLGAPVPLKLPNGRIGGAPNHTSVCR